MSVWHNIEPRSSGLATSEGSAPPAILPASQGYERWAPTYDQSPNPLIAREERYIEALLPALAGKNVLDLACGTGRWLQKMRERGARTGVGIDFSPAMLQVADRKPSVRGRLVRADCLHLPFPAAIFDFAICSFALSHIHDGLNQLAEEVARVMRPRAVVIVSDLHREAYARGWRTGFRDSDGACQIQMLPPAAEEIILAFHSSGFECLSHLPLCLGIPERPLFVEAGKAHFFAERARVPAVQVCQFQRRRSKGFRS